MRYEGQVRQRQQQELADTVISKIHKELENPKVLQQILQQSVSDVERKSSIAESTLFISRYLNANDHRYHDCQVRVSGLGRVTQR